MPLICRGVQVSGNVKDDRKLTWTPSNLFHLATTSSHELQRGYHSVYSVWLKLLPAYIRSTCSSVPQNTSSPVTASSLAKNGTPAILWSNKFWLEFTHLRNLIKRTHVVFSNSGKINKLLNIVPSQEILWANARSFKDSGWSKCPSRKNNKTRRPSHQWISSTLCSSNCVVNIFNPYCTSATTMIEIININI